MEEKKQILIRLSKENRIQREYYIRNINNQLEGIHCSYVAEDPIEEVISFYKDHAMEDFVYKCTLIVNPYLYLQDIYKIGLRMSNILSNEEENKLEIIAEVPYESINNNNLYE